MSIGFVVHLEAKRVRTKAVKVKNRSTMESKNQIFVSLRGYILSVL
jgi:hypothetical protein